MVMNILVIAMIIAIGLYVAKQMVVVKDAGFIAGLLAGWQEEGGEKGRHWPLFI